jgi:DNA polymerase III psi subunit
MLRDTHVTEILLLQVLRSCTVNVEQVYYIHPYLVAQDGLNAQSLALDLILVNIQLFILAIASLFAHHAQYLHRNTAMVNMR